MQSRQTLVALLAAIGVFYLVLFAYSWFRPAQPVAPTAPNPELKTPSTAPSGEQPTTRPATRPATATAPVVEAEQPGPVRIVEGTSREPVHLGSTDPDGPFPMLLEIDPVGAAVTNAWIRGHYETVEKKEPYHILMPAPLADKESAPGSFATPKIRFDDRDIDVSLDGRVWSLDPASTDTTKIWTLQINDTAGQALARVVKTYELPPQSPNKRTRVSTYDLNLSLEVENLSDEPARLILTQHGPLGIKREYQRSEDRMIITAFREDGGIETAKHRRTEVAKAGGKLAMGRDEDQRQLAWVAESNNYFTVIMAPAGRTGAKAPANASPEFSSVDGLTLIPGDPKDLYNKPGDMTYRFVTAPVTVPPGGKTGVAFNAYVGPKSKLAFETVPAYEQHDYYAVMTAGYYPCAPVALTGLMMRLLNFFHWIIPNYGVAIIILVLLVRAVLHPITKRSQVNMMKMQKQMARLQPKIDAVKQKYANDRMAMNQAMMEVYREEGVNPAGNLLTCLPMLLQIPIWGALWQALSSTIEMRHAPFDGWWIRDLAGQDALISFSKPYNIPIISTYLTGEISAFNLLPILLGISQVLQMKFMPRGAPPPGHASGPASDQMEQQRKMMMFMSGFFVLMLYNAPSGLNLYIMASNFFGVLEQWRIRKHVADLDKKQAAEPSKAAQPRKPSWLQRKWEELQRQAEEAKKTQAPRRRER